MKQEKLLKVLAVAALLFSSAAIDAQAQSKKATRKKPASNTADATGQAADTAATPDAAQSPAPAKLNRREQTPEQQPAPATAAIAPANAKPGGAANAAAAVRYTYEFNQPAFLISRIIIEHDAAGRGQVSFQRKDTTELYTDPLEISPAALGRITAAWEALKFLDSETNYQADKQYPHLGTMTLKMREGTRERKAEFNWTNDSHAEALVKEYKRIGEQQVFVFDMTIARQYQPSDTIKILKRLESLLDRGELSDTAQLVPFLRDLETDERIPLMARNHATRLLKKFGK